MRKRPAALALALAWAVALLVEVAAAQSGSSVSSVSLAGRMGDKALLVIEGRPRTVAVGETVQGVKLRRWDGDVAEVEQQGRSLRLQVGATPAQLGRAPAPASSQEVVLTAGPGGHFTSGGSINGRSVNFMVDTGATLVAMGRSDAERIGLDLRGARVAMTQTANGAVPVLLVNLNSVRVGDLELVNVGAAVMPQPMPMVLLGNSFLGRLKMQRENDVMRLERR